jgi:8-oxo-dGTP pyrophosphatase MutT (NUDIX family)
MSNWTTFTDGQRVEIGVLQIDIVGHSKLEGPSDYLKNLKDIFYQEVQSIVSRRGGRLFKWEGDGGAFMFPVASSAEVAGMVQCALQLLDSMPAINNEIALRTGTRAPISVRVSCDSGMVQYDAEPGKIHAAFLNHFFKNEREIALPNQVTLTDRIFKELPQHLKLQFEFFKESSAVGSKIYRFERRHDAASAVAEGEPEASFTSSSNALNFKRLKEFIKSNEYLRSGVELIKLTNHVPIVESAGVLTISPDQRRAAKKLMTKPYKNDPHAVLDSVPNWRDEPVVLRFRATDYVGICALSGPQHGPVNILSSSVVVVCSERREIYLHRRTENARTYPGALHTYGGAYMPPGVKAADDNFDLITTAQREVHEELNVTFQRKKHIPKMLAVELLTGFIQFVLLGVDVSGEDVEASRVNWEGRKVAVRFDDLPELLFDNETEWVPTGKAHLLAWLGLGAPAASQTGSAKFAGYSPSALFNRAVGDQLSP